MCRYCCRHHDGGKKLKAMTRQITADEEEKVGRIRALMRGYKDGVEANRKLLEAVASNVDDPDMVAFIQVGALFTLL